MKMAPLMGFVVKFPSKVCQDQWTTGGTKLNTKCSFFTRRSTQSEQSVSLHDSHLVDGDSVHIGVIHKPDDLVGEEFTVVLRGQVGLGGLR